MTKIQYDNACDKILMQTIQNVDTRNIKRFDLDQSIPLNPDDPVYNSAASSGKSIVLAYTPAGTGKSSLIQDRVKLLNLAGIPNERIMVLNMNIAKVKQMARLMPGIISLTFNDFTSKIFHANTPNCTKVDLESINSTLKLLVATPLIEQLINRISTSDPQERNLKLTLFANQYRKFTYGTLQAIRKSDYTLESMICQNEMYEFPNNPYDVDAILINGVTNMPIPILCSVLHYANRFGCNLFITGSPDETIYEYTMAYSNSMNVISSFNRTHDIDIIRLTRPKKMQGDILKTLNKNDTAQISRSVVDHEIINTNYSESFKDIAIRTLGPSTTYLPNKLKNKEPVLIIARSKNDIQDIKEAIVACYADKMPDLKILDLAMKIVPQALYGKFLADSLNMLKAKYPAQVQVGALFNDLWLIIDNAEKTASDYMKGIYFEQKNNLVDFANRHINVFGSLDNAYDLLPLVQTVINLEAEDIQNALDDIQNNETMDIENSDIVLSTIHTAMDIRMDNVIVFLKVTKDPNDPKGNPAADEALYRVALSRANKTEYIVFANYGLFEIPHQKYLKEHTI